MSEEGKRLSWEEGESRKEVGGVQGLGGVRGWAQEEGREGKCRQHRTSRVLLGISL